MISISLTSTMAWQRVEKSKRSENEWQKGRQPNPKHGCTSHLGVPPNTSPPEKKCRRWRSWLWTSGSPGAAAIYTIYPPYIPTGLKWRFKFLGVHINEEDFPWTSDTCFLGEEGPGTLGAPACLPKLSPRFPPLLRWGASWPAAPHNHNSDIHDRLRYILCCIYYILVLLFIICHVCPCHVCVCAPPPHRLGEAVALISFTYLPAHFVNGNKVGLNWIELKGALIAVCSE